MKRNLKKSITRLSCDFMWDRGGNFALIFAIMSTILALSVAMAVDTMRLHKAKMRLHDAADAAILAGTTEASLAHSNGDRQWRKAGENSALDTFEKNLEIENISGATLSADFRLTGAEIAGSGVYEYEFPLAFGRLIGRPTTQISDQVSAAKIEEKYIDITFLVDNSASMGIGATAADQLLAYEQLFDNDTNEGCAFACHIPKNDFEKQFTPEEFARIGAKTRMDVVREALTAAVTKIQADTEADRVRVSIFTFSNHIEEFVSPTTDLDFVKTRLSELDMVKLNAGGPTQLGGTYIRTAFQNLRARLNEVAPSGDGFTRNRRKSYILLFSDGVEDKQWLVRGGTFSDGADWFYINHTPLPGWVDGVEAENGIQPFDPESCAGVKEDDRTVFTAQVRYTVSAGWQDQWWNVKSVNYINSIKNDIEQSFTECASENSYHIIAENSNEIESVFAQILEDINKSDGARITH